MVIYSETNVKFMNYFENQNKNVDLTKSLQYKVPINSGQQKDPRMTGSRDNFPPKKNVQNSYNFKNPDDRPRMENQRGRDRTPNANRVNFEEPDYIEEPRSKSKKSSRERSRSAKKGPNVVQKSKEKSLLKESTSKASSSLKRSRSKSKSKSYDL